MADKHEDGTMEKHVHGTMNIDAQEKVFAGFITWVAYSTVVILVSLVLLYMVNG